MDILRLRSSVIVFFVLFQFVWIVKDKKSILVMKEILLRKCEQMTIIVLKKRVFFKYLITYKSISDRDRVAIMIICSEVGKLLLGNKWYFNHKSLVYVYFVYYKVFVQLFLVCWKTFQKFVVLKMSVACSHLILSF
jgi:hypothetical protein